MTKEYINEMIEKVGKWGKYNFPNALPHQPLLGMMEELGECVECQCNNDVQGEKDGIGDLMIFLFHYCDLNDITIDSNLNRSTDDVSIVITKLCKAHLKMEQGIRGSQAHHHQTKVNLIETLISGLDNLCNASVNASLQDCIEYAWNEVKDRDWIKYPLDGRTK
jgi:hypothetical protein